MRVPGFVREVGSHDGWVAARSCPKGYRLVIVDEFERDGTPEWRRLSKPRRCRHMANREGCGRPAVVELMRGSFRQPSQPPRPWGYCEQHLYSRHWEPPRLLTAIPVPEHEQVTG
jgi:hypothetical protein